MATLVSDLLEGILINVSNNSICKIIIMLIHVGALLSPQLQLDSLSMIYSVNIVQVQVVVDGSCDFIAQCILVCLINDRAYHPFLFTYIFKDLPLLDRVG
jgi:hypothetical protein